MPCRVVLTQVSKKLPAFLSGHSKASACSIECQYGQLYPHLKDFVEIRPLTLSSLDDSRPKRTARFDCRKPAFFLHSISV